MNETGQHADYVLPATTFLERSDVPVAFLPFFVKPFIQLTDAVVAPRGEARPGVARSSTTCVGGWASRRTACRRCAGSRGSASGSHPIGCST